jgi:hypothetical protein
MLLGDGSPTRHLRLLTGEAVAIDLIAMEAEQGEHPGAPSEVKELQAPLLRRQVWLTCGGTPLAWAESWWNQAEAELHLQDRNQPSGKASPRDDPNSSVKSMVLPWSKRIGWRKPLAIADRSGVATTASFAVDERSR